MPRNKKKSKSKIKKAQSAPSSPSKLTAYLNAPSAFTRGVSSASSDFETDDSMSMCSELVIDVGDISTYDLENEEQQILQSLEDFYSRGEASRLDALNTMFNKLSHRLHEDFLSAQLTSFTTLLRTTLTATTSYKQLEMACKLASIISISLSSNESHDFVNGFLIDLLMELIRHAPSIGSEVASIHALAFACYFAGNEDGLESTIGMLNGIWMSTEHDETHPKVVDAALQGWTFLMSKLGEDTRVEFLHEKITPLRTLMKSTSDVNVRISAAECISLYCDAWAITTPELRLKYPTDLSEIRQEFEEISNETGRRRRNDMRMQKSKFKQFFKAVPKVVDMKNEGDGADETTDEVLASALHDRIHKWRPSIKLRFRSRVFEFEGWDRSIEYHRIKDMLGSGTQTHMFSNPRLQAVFDLEDVLGGDMDDDMFDEGRGQSQDKERKKKVFDVNARKAQDGVKRGRRDKFERNNHFDDSSIW